MNRNRLDEMEEQVDGALAVIAVEYATMIEEYKSLTIKVSATHADITENVKYLDERVRDLVEEYGEIMDYLMLPWWRRLVTRRPR